MYTLQNLKKLKLPEFFYYIFTRVVRIAAAKKLNQGKLKEEDYVTSIAEQ